MIVVAGTLTIGAYVLGNSAQAHESGREYTAEENAAREKLFERNWRMVHAPRGVLK